MHPVREKLLLLLLGGIAFGYSITPTRQWKVISIVAKEWKNINKRKLYDQIRNLYKSKLVEKKENPDGTITLILTNKGKLKALTYKFREIKIKAGPWDRKWRMVVFDIPEKLRAGRDALRDELKELGFYELQKSVFVFPYECKDEIEFIIEFFEIKKYVRYGILESIDNDLHLRQIFKLV